MPSIARALVFPMNAILPGSVVLMMMMKKKKMMAKVITVSSSVCVNTSNLTLLALLKRTLRAKYALPPVVFYVVPYKNRRRCGLVSKKTTGGSVFLALHVLIVFAIFLSDPIHLASRLKIFLVD